MKKNVDDLLDRAVSNVTPRDLAEKKLASGKPLRLYMGIDPTGAKLHLGHSVPLRKMRAFQDAGHEVIFVIGSFTAMIGDPTGNDAMREPLTKEQVQENFESYIEQAKKILDVEKLRIEYNHEWLEKLNFADIIDLAGNFTVQQMLERDMFDNRLKKGNPIGLHEFFYPLMVGYDSVHLDVDCELGGNDQYFNMLAGRTLQQAFGKREKFVMTVKLLEGTDGRKMSKTYNNCIYITDDANDMYGKVMRINDDLMKTYFEFCTDVSMDEANKIVSGDPKEAKMRLAREIVTLYHDETAAQKAEEAFIKVFSEKGIPDNIQELSVEKGSLLVDALADNKIVKSKSEARRLIEQGAIKKDDVPLSSTDATADDGVYKVGKRIFVKIVSA